jgi:hypothetical protein
MKYINFSVPAFFKTVSSSHVTRKNVAYISHIHMPVTGTHFNRITRDLNTAF